MQFTVRQLTGDVDVGLSSRWRSNAVGWLATVPAGVIPQGARDDEAAVGVDAASR